MKRIVLPAVILFILLTPSLAEAQAITPTDEPTLGPIKMYLSGNGANVTIFSPQNQTDYPNNIQLIFTVKSLGFLGYFAKVVYSLDGEILNPINSVNITVDKSVWHDEHMYDVSGFANITLPTLSEGFHNITVYYGEQYSSTSHIYDAFNVYGHATVEFTVGNPTTPLPTISIEYSTNETHFDESIGGVFFELKYETNDTLSWVGYNIDGGSNLTVTGNSTKDASGFYGSGYQYESNGYHTLTLYANDTAGNWATPQNVTYHVTFIGDALPTSSENNAKLLGAIIIMAMITIGAGLIVYLKRHKPKIA